MSAFGVRRDRRRVLVGAIPPAMLQSLAHEKRRPVLESARQHGARLAIGHGPAKPRTQFQCSPPEFPCGSQRERRLSYHCICPITQAYATYADLGQFVDARDCIGEAITAMAATGERWCEPELRRIAGEIVLKLPEHDTAKPKEYFECAVI
jgi:hypothetical protein